MQIEKLKTTPEELLDLLLRLVKKDKPHKYYDENVKNAKLYKAIVSGRGLDEYMHQFKPREDAELFEQRKRITCHIVPSVCKNVRDVEYKVPRSNSITRVYLADKKEKELKALHDILDKFWGRYSFDNYINLRWIELNDTDPNAFVVIEWKPFEKTDRAQPYPYEVESEEAWDYEYENNILQWLLVKDAEDKLLKWTLYGPNNTVQLLEVSTDNDSQYVELKNRIQEDGVFINFNDGLFVRFNDKYYMLNSPKRHNIGAVPAIQVGFMRDATTEQDEFVYLPPWWAALPTLRNLITAKSELDLTEALHVFPQKFQYAPRCLDCNNGSLPTGDTCPKCKGTGLITHTTAGDAITLAMPRSTGEMLDLVNLVHNAYPPIDLVRYMDEYVEKLSRRCMQLVYNSEIYSRQQVAETATGKNIDLQAVYDTLYPLVEEMAIDWEFLIAVIQKVTDLSDGITAQFLYSKDFKLKSLDNYYQDLSVVNASGASAFVKSSIEDDIARMLYSDDRYAYSVYVTKERFNPFSGDSEQMIAKKLSDPNVSEDSKILYLNFEQVFDEIERSYTDGDEAFYFAPYKKQYTVVSAEVEKMKMKLKEQQANNRTTMFGV